MDARVKSLHDALSGVSTNGQAVAVADTAIGALQGIIAQFRPWADRSGLSSVPLLGGVLLGFEAIFQAVAIDRVNAFQALNGALADVQRYREPLTGDPSAAVGDASWDDLFHAIERAYTVIWAVQDVEGDETDWQAFKSWVASTAADSIAAMPVVAKAALVYTAQTAADIAKPVLNAIPWWELGAAAAGVAVLVLVATQLGRGAA